MLRGQLAAALILTSTILGKPESGSGRELDPAVARAFDSLAPAKQTILAHGASRAARLQIVWNGGLGAARRMANEAWFIAGMNMFFIPTLAAGV